MSHTPGPWKVMQEFPSKLYGAYREIGTWRGGFTKTETLKDADGKILLFNTAPEVEQAIRAAYIRAA